MEIPEEEIALVNRVDRREDLHHDVDRRTGREALAKNASRGQLRRRLLRIVVYDLLYVSYAAAVARTRAPLTGRLRGLRDWRADRTAGRPGRREIELAPPPGLLAALRRNRVYRSA